MLQVRMITATRLSHCPAASRMRSMRKQLGCMRFNHCSHRRFIRVFLPKTNDEISNPTEESLCPFFASACNELHFFRREFLCRSLVQRLHYSCCFFSFGSIRLSIMAKIVVITTADVPNTVLTHSGNPGPLRHPLTS